MNTDTLSSRLRNCLVTILEMESSLGQTPLGPALRKEFSVLKDVMQRLESTTIDENDVFRIEAATDRFLAELKETLVDPSSTPNSSTRLLQ